MFESQRSYLLIVLVHVVIGVVIFTFPALSKAYGYGIIIVGLWYMIKNQNRNHEVLYIAGYIVGSEVFLRMTSGNPVYEFSKYGVMSFILIGMYFKGFSKNAVPYWIFLALLIPGIIVAALNLNFDTNLKKAVSFNISGPLCLGITALYTYQRNVTMKFLNNILLMVGLPIITCMVYLILYTPDLRDIITGTGSNFETSGGFGPNQVSTILGIGMFIFFARAIFVSPSKSLVFINIIVAVMIGYRGLITFSRGGMITGVLMLVSLLTVTYFKVNSGGRVKMNYLLILLFLGMFGTWTYSAIETGGLIEKRYQNKDAAGRVKESKFTGREEISASEVATFIENPVFGVGVGKGVEVRLAESGSLVLSHNEITRMLAEHGAFGVMCLLILFGTPLVLYLGNKEHVYLLSFLAFWLLTINHAAMRLAAPAFIYALAILKVYQNDPAALHRK